MKAHAVGGTFKTQEKLVPFADVISLWVETRNRERRPTESKRSEEITNGVKFQRQAPSLEDDVQKIASGDPQACRVCLITAVW